MRSAVILGMAIGLIVLLAGCGSHGIVSGPPVNKKLTVSSSGTDSPWPNVDWVLTDALMKQKRWMTEYNQNLSINQGVYGKTSMYGNWRLPSKWAPYLYRNEHLISKGTEPAHLDKPTLFITLQGTVFLKSGVAMRYWPPLSVADIPPDATIVAEFVPLGPAVREGIIPVFQSQPQVDDAQSEVLKVLGMTQTEYQNHIGSAK